MALQPRTYLCKDSSTALTAVTSASTRVASGKSDGASSVQLRRVLFCSSQNASGHCGRGDARARRCEGGVAAEPLGRRSFAGEAETDRDERKAQQAAADSVQYPRQENNGKGRPSCERESRKTYGHQRESDDTTQGFRRIHQNPERNLTEQRDESADGQNKPDIQLGPFLVSEKDGDKRAESGLDIGDKKHQPIQALSAPTG